MGAAYRAYFRKQKSDKSFNQLFGGAVKLNKAKFKQQHMEGLLVGLCLLGWNVTLFLLNLTYLKINISFYIIFSDVSYRVIEKKYSSDCLP